MESRGPAHHLSIPFILKAIGGVFIKMKLLRKVERNCQLMISSLNWTKILGTIKTKQMTRNC